MGYIIGFAILLIAADIIYLSFSTKIWERYMEHLDVGREYEK